MDVEVLVVPGCPGSDAAAALLRSALDDIGLAGTPFSVRVIDSDGAARARRFAGSPAFVVDGVDLFSSCRIRQLTSSITHASPRMGGTALGGRSTGAVPDVSRSGG